MAKKRLASLLFLITLVTLLSIAFGQIIKISLVTPLDLFVFLLVSIWLLGKPIFKAKLTLPIFAFAGIGFFSLLINSQNLTPNQFFVSFLYLERWVFLAGIYFVVRDFDNRAKQLLLFWLAIAGVLTAALGIAQYFLYPDLRNLFYAGWDEHLYRVFGTFLDPNFAGAFFVLAFILILGLILKYKSRVLIIGLALTFIATLFTYSRSAYLMFVITISVFLILVGKKRLLVVILILFVAGVLLLPKNLPSEGVNLLRIASIQSRHDSAQNALTIFKDDPVFGVGFNAYRYAQLRYGFIEKADVHSGGGTDNSFLFVLATTGIVGLLVFIYLLYKILAVAKITNTITSKIVVAGILGLCVNSFFINSLFYESILAWFWVLIGAMEKK